MKNIGYPGAGERTRDLLLFRLFSIISPLSHNCSSILKILPEAGSFKKIELKRSSTFELCM
jgi:hypothetical protein